MRVSENVHVHRYKNKHFNLISLLALGLAIFFVKKLKKCDPHVGHL